MAERGSFSGKTTKYLFQSFDNKFRFSIVPIQRYDVETDRWIMKINLQIYDSISTYFHNSDVLYYYSIGETNGMRAFFLLPMLYFNTRTSIGETSDWGNGKTNLARNGLLKNESVSNLKFGKDLNNYIFKQAVDAANKLGIDKTSRHSSDQGLFSILHRMNNIIDFIVATNILDPFEHTLQSFMTSGIYKIYKPKIEDHSNFNFDDIWRFYILEAITQIRKNFLNLFSVIKEEVDVNRVDLSTLSHPQKYFNSSQNIFIKDSQNKNTNKLTDEYKKNHQEYINLSTKLYFEISILRNQALEKNLIDGSTYMNDPFNLLRVLKSPSEVKTFDLIYLLKQGWKVDVQKKYLKYKSKYIKLKKLLNDKNL